jgi:hypothetical protein
LQSNTGTETDWLWDMDSIEQLTVNLGSNYPGMVPGSDVRFVLRDGIVWVCES